MTEEDISLANAIVDLFKNFYRVYLTDFNWNKNGYAPFPGKILNYNNGMGQIYDYYNNIAGLLDKKNYSNTLLEAHEIKIQDDGIKEFQAELNLLSSEDFKLFLGNLLDFIKVYKLDTLKEFVESKNIIEGYFKSELFNSNCKEFFNNLIKDFIEIRNSISEEENYKKLFASIRRNIDNNKLGSDIFINIKKIENYKDCESKNRDSIKDILKNIGIYERVPFISDDEQDLLQAFYSDEELTKKFEWNRNEDNKTLRFGIENLIDNIRCYGDRDSYEKSGNAIKILSFRYKDAVYIIEAKNNCGFMCDMEKLRWECNLHNRYIGFNIEFLSSDNDNSNSTEENDLETLEKLGVKLENITPEKSFKGEIEDFKKNNERLGKLLEDFLEDNEKAKGWYYENADEKRVINEFQIIEQYRDTPSTQTNPVVKKANATESSNKKTFMNGHHFIASEWAKEVINKFLKESNKFVEFYDKYKAPVIMLRDTYRDSSHADITQSQRKRRMMTNSYIEERTLARKELQSIVVSEKNLKENEEDSKAYYDTLSSFEKKELQLLRIWELYQIEKGLKIVDDFYNEIRKAIKNEVVNNRNKYVYAKDNIPADENNINARLSEIFGY